MPKIKISVVTPKGETFFGVADTLIATGSLGELGIVHGHSPLITILVPGPLKIIDGEKERDYYISGGILEVNKNQVTVLADLSIQAETLIEQEVLKAQEKARNQLSKKISNIEYAKARAELINSTAQLAAIRKLFKKN